MSAEAVPRTDRRHVRRAETIERIVDIAVDVMAEFGVGALSLGEVARRIGIRTPSLYVYFDSKNAVYDAVFARGWRLVEQAMAAVGEPDETTDLPAHLLLMGETFVRWSVEHPVHTQLMAWRPVPGYTPSAEAYHPAVHVLDRGLDTFARLQRLGLFRTDADPDELLRAWTVVISGVVSQQLSNAPHEPYERGSFTAMLPELMDMFRAHYAPPPDPTRKAPAHGRRR